jgi:uncharacterized membrane protein
MREVRDGNGSVMSKQVRQSRQEWISSGCWRRLTMWGTAAAAPAAGGHRFDDIHHHRLFARGMGRFMFDSLSLLLLVGLAYGILVLLLPWLLRGLYRRIRRLEAEVAALRWEADDRARHIRAQAQSVQSPADADEIPARPAVGRKAEHVAETAEPAVLQVARAELPPDQAATAPAASDDGWRAAAADEPPSGAAAAGSELGLARRNPLLDWFTGPQALARLGVLVLFFGVAFLLKFAVDEGLLPIELRLAGAALGGLALVKIGWRLRAGRRGYALILQGGGIAIVYLTVFAAVSLYGLLAVIPGQILMMVLVVLGAALAVLQDSRALALFALGGGFLAPVLVSSGGSHVVLFGYYAVLNLGILGIAWFKAWRELNLAGFLFTFVIASLWGHKYYRPEYFASTEPFLLLFFLFYVAVAVLFALRQPPDLKGYVDGTLVFGVPLAAAGLQAALVGDREYGLAISALFVGLFYLTLAYVLWRRTAGLRLMVEAFVALGVVFATLAIPFAIDGRLTGAAWALEGAALVWVGIRQNRLAVRVSGILLQLAAGLAVISTMHAAVDPPAVFNSRYLAACMIALGGGVTGLLLYRARAALNDIERQLVVMPMAAWGLAWWFAAGLLEIDRFAAPGQQLDFALLFVTASVLAGIRLADRLEWPHLRYPAVGLLPFMILLAVVAYATEISHPLRAAGLLAWPLALASHYRLLRRFETAMPGNLAAAGHTVALWLVVFLAAWELSWLVQLLAPGQSAWTATAWAAVPVAIVTLVISGATRVAWPLQAWRATYLRQGLVPLILYLLLWVVYAASLPGDPVPLPYLPLLNPLELMQLAALGAITIWVVQAAKPGLRRRSLQIVGLVGFVALNGAIARSVHFLADVPFALDAMLDSGYFQTTASIVWTVTALALTLTASRKGLRSLWFAGIAMLGLVVIKLFLVDLAEVGTVGRIVSFIVVGLLILVVAYRSPLPPGDSQERSS